MVSLRKADPNVVEISTVGCLGNVFVLLSNDIASFVEEIVASAIVDAPNVNVVSLGKFVTSGVVEVPTVVSVEKMDAFSLGVV